MKIAVFTDIYTPSGTGGIVSSIRAQKAELERLGHEVIVFCPGFKTKESNVILVPSHQKITINGTVLAKKPRTVEEFVLTKFPDFNQFDIVHVHYEASCSIAGVHLAHRFDIPLVQTMHGREDMAIAMNVPHPVKNFAAGTLAFLHGKSLARPCAEPTLSTTKHQSTQSTVTQSTTEHSSTRPNVKHTSTQPDTKHLSTQSANSPAKKSPIPTPTPSKVRRDKFQAPTFARSKMWQLMVNHAEQADVVTTPADHLAKKLEHYGVTRPIVTVPNGIPEDLVNRQFCTREMRDGDVLKIIWSSRVSNEKRILPFLQAVAQLKRPYVLYVYGNGNAEKKARDYARRHNMKVKFYGAVPREKIVARMQEAHLSVLASYNFDTQGMVLLEAEATGLPVFLCDPTLMEVVPAGSFLLAGGPEPTAMSIALENCPAEKIQEMSKIMLKHRHEVLQSEQIKKMLKVYRLAQAEHKTRTAS